MGLAPEILGLAPELKILHQCFKRVKTKNQIVLGANSYVAEVAGEKLVGGAFCPHLLSHLPWAGLSKVESIHNEWNNFLYQNI